MMKKNKDSVVVHDRNGRRTLLREGAALVLAGSTLGVSGAAFGDDCDRAAASGESKTPGTNGSDSDAGDNADRAGCGKGHAQISSLVDPNKPKVAKIKG